MISIFLFKYIFIYYVITLAKHYMSNKSPLRYPGGKSKACKVIEAELLNNDIDLKEFTTLISPFFGGGSFEFYLQNKYSYTVKANDKFTPLMSFWTSAKNNNEELYNLVKDIKAAGFSKEKFTAFRKDIMNIDIDSTNEKLKQAAYYFAINRSSFSGATLSGGFSKESSEKRFTTNSIKLIANLDLSKFQFSNEDANDFIKEHTVTHATEKQLIFLDPPYYLEEKSKLYGCNGDMHEDFDHAALAETLNTTANAWAMTYNDCQYIRDLYKDYRIIDMKWNYGMNKSKKSSEILILNRTQ